MNYKSNILSVILCLLPASVFAQIEYDIIRPSVNAEQFSLGAKAETALSKGQISLDIPLMELKGKGYNLPVSLTFYNGDVTFRTESSPIGLGWALMAGGVITKTVRGVDDSWNGADNEHLTNGDFITESFEAHRYNMDFIGNIMFDPMPDEYTYSLPGHSGTIEFPMDGSTTSGKLYPDESYTIERINRGYCITADDGTKFYFKDVEYRDTNNSTESTSWFLSKIETIKGGIFTFNYEKEEYVDLTTEEDDYYYTKYTTNRISSIVSDYGTVTFFSEQRDDRGSINNQAINVGLNSQRINRIELSDENGNFIKGYELDNSGWVTHEDAPDNYWWTDIRHILSSVTQYDSIGNRLPPYEFEYSYKFAKSRLAEIPQSAPGNGYYFARDSWTSNVEEQVYVNLNNDGNPDCWMVNPNSPYTSFMGISFHLESSAATADDFFNLESITYPTGAMEIFTYEDHDYQKVNWSNRSAYRADKIHGKRIKKRIIYGTEIGQQTEYIYRHHGSNYNVTLGSSGVMTNPSIHGATYYTPQRDGAFWKYIASRKTSEKAYNSFMGPPVCYTEVEEIEEDMDDNVLNRTIHYFEPQIVSPPINYIFVYSRVSPHTNNSLIEVGNRIYGTISGYTSFMDFLNHENKTYIAYPVGEFYSVAYNSDKPVKDVFIGKDGRVRNVKEYEYRIGIDNTKYGYRIISQDYYTDTNSGFPQVDYTAYLISKSEFITRKFRPTGVRSTTYYYNENSCDSICEHFGQGYNKGRLSTTTYTRNGLNENNESETTRFYFPGDISNMAGYNSSAEIRAINGLIGNNIIANPIKTVTQRNGYIIGGECRDYQMQDDIPLLKSIYKIKNTDNNRIGAPVLNGNNIDYRADIYKDGEVLTYDEYHNPEHIRIKETQDRIYVWGYNGRFPVAIIDNMDYASFCTNNTLKSMLRGLAQYTKIESEQECINLRNANAAIRHLLPEAAHITTFTYDPYFGITSEMDASNYGLVYTYDTFGRLSAKYDANYKKLEEYNYNFYRQQ